MLNADYRKTAIRDLEQANEKYKRVFQETIKNIERLQRSRQRAIRTIKKIESYLCGLANKPREYEIAIGEVKTRYLAFNNQIEEIKRQSEEQETVSYKPGIGGGILVGAGTAALAPSAAMAVAMTFGTASTGTAIASLSGIAATNAALAWLGGGTLIAGGAGIAGGQALLTMAGPVGWVIGGTSALGGILLQAITNHELAKKAEKATKTILKEAERIKEINATVCAWNKETIRLCNELEKQITTIRRKKDYNLFSAEDKYTLISVMNMTELLSKKLGETVS